MTKAGDAIKSAELNVGTELLVNRPLISGRRRGKEESIALSILSLLVFGTSFYFKAMGCERETRVRAKTPESLAPPKEVKGGGASAVAAPPMISQYRFFDAAFRYLKGGESARRGIAQKFYGPQLISRPQGVAIPPGTLVGARLVSGASNGPVKATLTDAIYVNGDPVVEEGTVLLGTGASTEERLFVRFSKLVFRDGRVEKIAAEAADQSDKIAGLKGSKIGNHALRLAGSIGLNFISGMSEVLQDQHTNPMGMPVKETSLKNALLNGTEKASMEEAGDILSGLKDARPIIEVPAGTSIYVLIGEGNE